MDKNRVRKLLLVLIISSIAMYTFFYTGDIQGECTKFNMSYIYFTDESTYEYYVNRTSNSLQVISPNYFNINDDGSLKITSKLDKKFIKNMHNENVKVVPFLSNHWDREKGRKALENRYVLVNQIVQAINKYNLDGINVDLENLTELDRDNYTDFVKLLRQELSEEKEVSVAVAANPKKLSKGWHGSYDYKELSKYSDYLMLMTYDESYYGSYPGPVASISFVEESIKVALEEVPAEKIVLGIPFYGRYWNLQERIGGRGISLIKIQELIKKYNGQVTFDKKNMSPVATFIISPKDEKTYVYGRELKTGNYVVWFENEESIKSKLRLVQKYNLKGTGSWSLGQEPENTWDYYNLWLNGKYYKDIEGHWAMASILDVESKGWMKGISNTHFAPNKSLTRAQAAVTLVRILGLEDNTKEDSSFKDIKGHWAEKEITIAEKQGLIKGIEENKFAPDESVTREQMAVMLDRLLNLEKNESTEVYYKDIVRERWSYEAIVKMTKHNIFKGFNDKTFKPRQKITRAQMATLLNRISHLVE
ncbi:glycosyl hydrolase family 18 protein [Caldisalinibacter kiritimatiensis]|uniref:Membrane-bound lytic murein transglycosylase D n=1 Tax=Caldisalinibacter kiritimatiensis TaxID=1304284 RepID=R1CAG9_9FIRM|nr:glycosyl hydrolase family 18 protein [Caldisalinibacter kiritimatiensis]EOC99319.1 Membrane-bound lytic murein transglycosylase D precursor [Caldisalinibacter kiritimatiensis]